MAGSAAGACLIRVVERPVGGRVHSWVAERHSAPGEAFGHDGGRGPWRCVTAGAGASVAAAAAASAVSMTRATSVHGATSRSRTVEGDPEGDHRAEVDCSRHARDRALRGGAQLDDGRDLREAETA